MSNIDILQAKLPKFYRKYPIKGENERSNLYPVLNSFAKLLDENMDIVERIDAMIGVDTTWNEDLYHRWGSLLNINKGKGSWGLFRNKIKLAMLSGVGGTKQAIKFAVAIIASIEDNTELQDKYIQVIDAWEYDGVLTPSSSDPDFEDMLNSDHTLNDSFKLNAPYDPRRYGGFVVVLDLMANEMILTPDDGIVWDTINTVKAAGTSCYLVYVYSTDETVNIVCDHDMFDEISDIFGDIPNVEGEYSDRLALAQPIPTEESSNISQMNKDDIIYEPMLNSRHTLNHSFILNTLRDEYSEWIEDLITILTHEIQKLEVQEKNLFSITDTFYDVPHIDYSEKHSAAIVHKPVIESTNLSIMNKTEIIYEPMLNSGHELNHSFILNVLRDEYGEMVEDTIMVVMGDDGKLRSVNTRELFSMTDRVADSGNIGVNADKILDKVVDQTYHDIVGIPSENTQYLYDDIGCTNETFILNRKLDTDNLRSSNIIVRSDGIFKGTESLRSSMKESVSDSTCISTVVQENLVTKALQNIKDTGAFLSRELNAWSRNGTNSHELLNITFITNMREETDNCADIITYNNRR